MKIALFGGTFDPIHNGHLAVAREAADRFELDQVIFIPTGRPPHKHDGPRADYEHRYRMVELACRADARFKASRLEDPATLGDGKTYSIDTIEKVSSDIDPGDSLFFLIGQDAFDELSIWHRLEDVVRKIEFIVATRPSQGPSSKREGAAANARFQPLSGLKIPTSATRLREQLAEHVDVSASLPLGVDEYIRQHLLYL